MRFPVFALLLGCSYAPLGHEDAVPVLADSRLDADLTVFGEADFTVGYFSGQDFRDRCDVERIIEGFVPDETPAGCESCADYFVLALRSEGEDDAQCRWAPAVAFNVGFGDLVDYPGDDYPRTWQWLQDEDAVGVLRSDWTPSGFGDAVAPQYFLGLFETDEAESLGYSRSYRVETSPYYHFPGPQGAVVEVGNTEQPAAVGWNFTLWIQ